MFAESLSERQVKFLDELGRGPRGVRELMEDHALGWREFKKWEEEPAFTEALEKVFAWLEFVCETDVRIGAVEALRRQRLLSEGKDFNLNPRQREAGERLWKKARELDKSFPRTYRQPGKRGETSPIHPKYLHEAKEVVQRMEELRREALAARAREKAAAANRWREAAAGGTSEERPGVVEEASKAREQRGAAHSSEQRPAAAGEASERSTA